jgi:DHA1 family bicyclomycin/chloramphenicol resistance-like MFS transporter
VSTTGPTISPGPDPGPDPSTDPAAGPGPAKTTQTADKVPHPGLGFGEFVTIIAFLMALNALAIDIMLPALPQIGEGLSVANPNDTQLVLIAYLLGFGPGQLLYGPLSDRYGRKPILLAGLAIYSVAGVIATLTTSFEAMLLARAIQGVGCAAPRIIALSAVRDCYEGRKMASVMSLGMMVFMAIPIIAPSIGQLITIFVSWRGVFAMLLLGGIIMLVWTSLRLPETLDPANRRPIRASSIFSAYKTVLTTRQSFGYAMAAALVIGTLFGFIASAQQVFVGVFGLGNWFPIAFGTLAIFLGLSAFLNSQLVERFGMRRMSHTGLTLYLVVSLAQTGLAYMMPGAGFWAFAPLLGLQFFLFGFLMSNFNALAMEPHGTIAGTASSTLGFMTTTIGAICGGIIGALFNGTILPFAAGFAILAGLALMVVWLTEGRIVLRGQ